MSKWHFTNGQLHGIRRTAIREEGSLSLADMIAAGKYDGVSTKLTEDVFKIKPARFTTHGSTAFHFDYAVRLDELDEGLEEIGHRLVRVEALLAYGSEHPEEQRNYPIIGRSYGQMTPFLTANAGGRKIYVGMGLPKAYRAGCRFLAMPID